MSNLSGCHRSVLLLLFVLIEHKKRRMHGTRHKKASRRELCWWSHIVFYSLNMWSLSKQATISSTYTSGTSTALLPDRDLYSAVFIVPIFSIHCANVCVFFLKDPNGRPHSNTCRAFPQFFLQLPVNFAVLFCFSFVFRVELIYAQSRQIYHTFEIRFLSIFFSLHFVVTLFPVIVVTALRIHYCVLLKARYSCRLLTGVWKMLQSTH